MASFVTSLVCSRCGSGFDHRGREHLCPCGGPLLVDYDLEAAGRSVDPAAIAGRAAGGMWRFAELLPVEDPARVVSLGEGGTPMVDAPRLAGPLGVGRVLVKDDGLNPTGSFKARGAAAGVTAALERGVAEVALPTAGNAGVAWAAYGAAAGIGVHVAMPADAPRANIEAVRRFGASLTLVDGLISDAGRVIADGIAEHGWYDAGTLREPYRIEGKKTLGFEIAEGLGWRFPGAVVYPAGGGVGLIGMWRAFAQLRALGWVGGDVPRLIVVQSTGCAPIVRAFEHGRDGAEPWVGAATIAQGLRVPSPLGDRLVLRAVRETGGTAVAVDDALIFDARDRLAAATGVLASPEGAATLAGAEALAARGDFGPDDVVVLVNTGSGLVEPGE
ncbi:MAG TPA: threonine synthase [Actinomycetota bacterium]|nr:threonine synthase [Actinomycetota bacterium]